jgi:anthranilate synthase/aminodeoxychorismate synthase-like glutamine amidotransferase
MKILLLDNYDSFTWNLVHYLIIGGAEVQVLHNDEVSAADIGQLNFDGLLLGPGPCTPQESGCLMQVIDEFAEKTSVLGVCLGHQALGMHFGWTLKKAALPVHGKARNIIHHGEDLFAKIPNPMQVGRYHSLIIEPPENPGHLEITATCAGEVMAVKLKSLPLWGVQFHPESILTTHGQTLINNWLSLVYDRKA